MITLQKYTNREEKKILVIYDYITLNFNNLEGSCEPSNNLKTILINLI